MSEKCVVCKKTVDTEERVYEDKTVFHKDCFRCKTCQMLLKPGQFCQMDGIYYCTPHFGQLFKAQGNLGGKPSGDVDEDSEEVETSSEDESDFEDAESSPSPPRPVRPPVQPAQTLPAAAAKPPSPPLRSKTPPKTPPKSPVAQPRKDFTPSYKSPATRVSPSPAKATSAKADKALTMGVVGSADEGFNGWQRTELKTIYDRMSLAHFEGQWVDDTQSDDGEDHPSKQQEMLLQQLEVLLRGPAFKFSTEQVRAAKDIGKLTMTKFDDFAELLLKCRDNPDLTAQEALSIAQNQELERAEREAEAEKVREAEAAERQKQLEIENARWAKEEAEREKVRAVERAKEEAIRAAKEAEEKKKWLEEEEIAKAKRAELDKERREREAREEKLRKEVEEAEAALAKAKAEAPKPAAAATGAVTAAGTGARGAGATGTDAAAVNKPAGAGSASTEAPAAGVNGDSGAPPLGAQGGKDAEMEIGDVADAGTLLKYGVIGGCCCLCTIGLSWVPFILQKRKMAKRAETERPMSALPAPAGNDMNSGRV